MSSAVLRDRQTLGNARRYRFFFGSART